MPMKNEDINQFVDDVTEEEMKKLLNNMPINNARLISVLMNILEEKGLVTQEDINKKFNELLKYEDRITEIYNQKNNGGVEIVE